MTVGITVVMQNQSEKAILLRFLFLAVFLHITYTCPADELMKPCTCQEDVEYSPAYEEGRMQKLVITCESTHVEQVRKALQHIDQTVLPADVKLVGVSFVDHHLPSDLFAGLNLRDVDILNCTLKSVDQRAFSDRAGTLRSVTLDYNDLERVPTESLQNMLHLRYLSLDFNRLEVLHAFSFKGLHALEVVSLKSNRIKVIDDSAFAGKQNGFYFLKLTDNELSVFPSRALSNFSSIKFLELQNNRIAALEPDEMAVMDGLAFKILNLEGNRVRHLQPGTFESQTELEGLLIRGNEMESVHPQAFRGLEGTLDFLALSDNRLNEIPAASMRALRRLVYLYLDGNSISAIRKDDFLSYGKSLKYIYLENNSLSSVDPMALVSLDSVKTLHLGWNHLQTFPQETYAPVVDTLKTFFIFGNPLHCDCKMAWLRDWIAENRWQFTYGSHEIKCASPEQLVDKPLEEIPKDQLICRNSTSKNTVSSCTGSEGTNDASRSRDESVDALALSILRILIKYF